MHQYISLPIFLFLFILSLLSNTNQDVIGAPGITPTLTVSPDCSDQQITQITINGTNWLPNETIQIHLDDRFLTARTATHSGNFRWIWQMQSPAQGGHIVHANSDSFHLSSPFWIGCKNLSTVYLPLIQSSATENPPSHTPLLFSYLEVGSLAADQLAFNQIDANINLHQFEITESGTLTISAVTDLGQDISLSMVDTSTDQIIGQNLVQGHEIETAVFTNLNPAHTYHLNVNNPTPTANNYIALVWGDEGLILEAKEILNYGEVVSTTIPASDSIRQFYFFYGEAGDIISIKTTTTTSPPNDDPVMVISVYDVDGNYLELDGDEVLWFDEEITDIHLPKTGLYTFWLEELEYEMANYTVTVIKEQ